MSWRNEIQDVLLLSAGFGTRLKPLTDSIPKPLVEVGGKPLIAWSLELIAEAGFKRVFINLHYLADKIKDYVGDGSRWGMEVVYFFEEEILGTGGAIKNVESHLQSDNLLTLNSDILFANDFSIADLCLAHCERKPAVTMVLREDKDSEKYGELGVDKAGRVVSFLGEQYIEGEVVDKLMYTGCQVISRSVFFLLSFHSPSYVWQSDYC